MFCQRKELIRAAHFGEFLAMELIEAEGFVSGVVGGSLELEESVVILGLDEGDGMRPME
jgi:hypothetical protein